jgi:hypothetical protein
MATSSGTSGATATATAAAALKSTAAARAAAAVLQAAKAAKAAKASAKADTATSKDDTLASTLFGGGTATMGLEQMLAKVLHDYPFMMSGLIYVIGLFNGIFVGVLLALRAQG